MFSIYTTILLLAATATAQEAKEIDRGWFGVGSAKKLLPVDDQSLELLEQARIQPNLTRSVKFNPFDRDPVSEVDSDLVNVEWNWRVNVSEFAVPHARLADKPDTIPHMVITTYDFDWPSGGNVSSQINDTGPFCIATEYTYSGLAKNVTNAFGDDDADSTDCTPALGSACISAILQQEILVNGTCEHPDTTWARLPACADSFGYSVDERKTSAILRGVGDLNAASNATAVNRWQYKSGDLISFSTTSIFDPGAEDGGRVFRNESRALQVIMVKTNASDVGQEAVSLLCMRVDTEDIEGSAARFFLGSSGLFVTLLATALILS